MALLLMPLLLLPLLFPSLVPLLLLLLSSCLPLVLLLPLLSLWLFTLPLPSLLLSCLLLLLLFTVLATLPLLFPPCDEEEASEINERSYNGVETALVFTSLNLNLFCYKELSENYYNLLSLAAITLKLFYSVNCYVFP